ncbi:LysR family transcriptional regulator [Pantoea vagans]|uniref:LysR family transcriptional regulator n=1 Tax=Pantoea vagans TaxID=470934 RepID=UPI0023B032E2|nr:LysR family transcriptional regulator [Pantoea vagans]MDE8557617.1 LysR family transcriptional regulator [Pantoea vagans]MDE8577185.1 LysR family transcriptional regulator [Pantoea vagans]
MTNLVHWRLMLAVADVRNISRSAEETGMTQSAASQAIAQRESLLGFPVFVRERRHIGVTALGEQVIEHARTMLMQLNAIRELADESRGLQGGRIRLASFPSVTATFLPALLRNVRRLYPDMEVVVLEGTDEEVEEWLAADTIELGVVMNSAPGRADVILGRDAWVAVMPVSYPQSGAKGITLQALADQPFVLATGGCVINGKSLIEQAGFQFSDVRIKVRDWISACMLVREGMGVALVPKSALPAERRGLSVVPITPSIHHEFGLVCSLSGNASQAAQTFLKRLKGQ